MFDMKANNVKVGDKLVDNKGETWEVTMVDTGMIPFECRSSKNSWCWFHTNGDCHTFRYEDHSITGFAETDKVVQQPGSNKAHKHKDLIIAWANGKSIEYKNYFNGTWVPVAHPEWEAGSEYRIKPEPKPDVVKYLGLEYEFDEERVARGEFRDRLDCVDHWDNQLKLTFCGETGKLKSAEVINKD